MSYLAGQKLRASQMSVYDCTSGTRPAGHAGQVIHETDTGSFAVFTGGVWVYFGADGTVSTSYRGAASGVQAIPTSTDTTVAFGTDAKTTALVTKSTQGSGHQFTVNRAGLWALNATVRCASSATGERFTAIYLNGSPINGSGGPGASNAVTHSVSETRDLAVNDVIRVNFFQSSGGSLNLDITATGVKVNLSWIHG